MTSHYRTEVNQNMGFNRIFSVTMRPEMVERIGEITRGRHITRSAWIRFLIQRELDMITEIEKVEDRKNKKKVKQSSP